MSQVSEAVQIGGSDTSVLVAGLHRAHPHHARALVWVDAVAEGDRLITFHALAELWSGLTRLPGSARTSPEQALQVVRRVPGVFDVRPLEPAIYDFEDQEYSARLGSRCPHRGLAERAEGTRPLCVPSSCHATGKISDTSAPILPLNGKTHAPDVPI
jgi:hypothetical protein